MLTALLAFAPLFVAYAEVALIRRLLGERTRASHFAAGPSSAARLSTVLSSLGLELEALAGLDAQGEGPFAIVCRDPRAVVGGRVIVHALPIGDDSAAASADVLMLADSLWRARGVKGVLVANAFTRRARAAVRSAPQVVELVTWGELERMRIAAATSAELPLMAPR